MNQEEIKDSSSVLARTALEENDDTVKLHKGQSYSGGILPKKSGHQFRKIQIDSCSLVEGSVVGGDVTVNSSEKILLSNGDEAPGTEIHGSVNALNNVKIGYGVWIKGGIIAEGSVEISSVNNSGNVPGHILIEGGVSGKNVIIGDGVVILGPVVALESVQIGNRVSVRDQVYSPSVNIGDGCLLGGVIAENKLDIGVLNTVASGSIVVPKEKENMNTNGPIRSPYPGCNNCPNSEYFEGPSKIARMLSCHFFADITNNEVLGGGCNDWTQYPLNIDSDISIGNGKLVTNIPPVNLNFTLFGDDLTIWQRGGEL